MKKVLYIITIVLLLAVFCFSGFQVVNYFVEGKSQAEQYDELAALKEQAKDKATAPTEKSGETKETQETDPNAETESTEDAKRNEDGMLLEYVDLYEMNRDMVGWIKIEGTEVDYPVMQSPDRVDYYLDKNFFGEYSKRGCIYAREVCDINLPSDNITIYGHNMMDGSMFAALHTYIDKKVWEENPIIQFDTLYDHNEYKIFAVFRTTATVGEGFRYHQFVDAQSEADFNDFIATCKKLDYYDTGITPEYGDKIICLSTGEYTEANGRLVVAAVRIDG